MLNRVARFGASTIQKQVNVGHVPVDEAARVYRARGCGQLFSAQQNIHALGVPNRRLVHAPDGAS